MIFSSRGRRAVLPFPLPPSVILRERSLSLSFRASEASREICFKPGVSAAASFHAANGGASFGCASLRPLPESTASSLRDNLYLQGPSPCTLRGWICPPYGSTKALWSQRCPVILRDCASLCHFERNTECGVEKSRFLRALRLVEMTKGHSLGRDDIGGWWWEGESMVPRGEFGCDG